MRLARFPLAAGIAATAALVAVPAASATTVVTHDPSSSGSPVAVTVQAQADRTNIISTEFNGLGVVIRDDGDLVVCGANMFACHQLSSNRVQVDHPVTSLLINAGNLSDTVDTQVFDIPATINGGAGTDQLKGSNAADTLNGDDDTDFLTGRGGADSLNGGNGADLFPQGAAADGADAVIGGPGTDEVQYVDRTAPVFVSLDGVRDDGAAGERDNVFASVENVISGTADDVLTGSQFTNRLEANMGNDTLDGRAGNDALYGYFGNDTFVGGAAPDGGDGVFGQGGTDTMDYSLRSGTLTVELDNVRGDGEISENDNVAVENVRGGSATDYITGNSAANRLEGGGGGDSLRGNDGNDGLFGDGGDDTILQGSFQDGNDSIVGGSGVDLVDYSQRSNALDVSLDGLGGDGEGTENDNVFTSVENVWGGSGADNLIGSGSANYLEGNLGADAIEARGGDDTVHVQNGDVDAGISCGSGFDTVFADPFDPVLISGADACENVQSPVINT